MNSSKIFPNVHIGSDSELQDFLVLGLPPKGRGEGELALSIGARAIIRSHSVFYSGSRIGARFQCGHGALVREECLIGDDCSVGSGSVLEFKVTLGVGVRVHSQVFIPEHSVLEDGCWIGPNVVLTNAKFPQAKRTKELLAGVRVGRGAKIGANSTLLPGVVIGAGALIGAGSVVTHDVPPHAVVVGNPARVVGRTNQLRYPDSGELVYEEHV